MTNKCSEQEDRGGEWNQSLMIHKGTINELLCQLGIQKTMGTDGILPNVLRELAEVPIKALSIT